MKRGFFVYVSCFVCFCVSAQDIATTSEYAFDSCDASHWGLPDCLNYCGKCNVTFDETETTTQSGTGERMCDLLDGSCLGGCFEGWEGERCDQALCDGGCGTGMCVAPGLCQNCEGKSYVSPHCTDIRLRGIMAAGASCVVLTATLLFCHIVSCVHAKRNVVR